MAGREHGQGLQVADHIGVTVFEQRIKLGSIALEFRAFIKDFSESFLNNHDTFADAYLAAQFLLKVWGSAQVICVDMGLDDPL